MIQARRLSKRTIRIRCASVGALDRYRIHSIGLPASSYSSDPCPEIPTVFVDPARMTREIKGFSGDKGEPAESTSVPNGEPGLALLRPDELLVATRPKPLVRSVVATTIQQINRRVKGTEKFWSENANPMLQLRADLISDNQPLDRFWKQRGGNLPHWSQYNIAT